MKCNSHKITVGRAACVIATLAIAILTIHLTVASALAEVEDEGVMKCAEVEPTPLHNAIDAENYDEARKQIKGKYVNVIAGYLRGNYVSCHSPLRRTLVRGDVSRIFIDDLIDGGADVNLEIFRGWSPLHNAAYNGRTETALALIAAGADVNVKVLLEAGLRWMSLWARAKPKPRL